MTLIQRFHCIHLWDCANLCDCPLAAPLSSRRTCRLRPLTCRGGAWCKRWRVWASERCQPDSGWVRSRSPPVPCLSTYQYANKYDETTHYTTTYQLLHIVNTAGFITFKYFCQFFSLTQFIYNNLIFIVVFVVLDCIVVIINNFIMSLLWTTVHSKVISSMNMVLYK